MSAPSTAASWTPIAALDWFLSPRLKAAPLHDLRRARFLAGCALLMMVLLSVSVVTGLVSGMSSVVWACGLGVLVWASVFPMLRFDHDRLAGMWVAGYAALAMLWVVLHRDAMFELYDPWEAAIVMAALYLGGTRFGIVVLVSVLLEMVGIPVLARHGWLIETAYLNNSGPTAAGSGSAIIAIFGLGWLYSTARDAANQALERTLGTLSESREQFRSLVEQTHAIPIQIDTASLQVRYVGPQAQAFLAVPIAEWAQPGFLCDRIHPDDLALLRRWAEGGSVEREGTLRFKHADGSWRWAQAVLSTVVPGTGVLQGLLLDVTERRVLELELRQAQKLESVGRLASGIAHEINTPVQFVNDSVHFVQDAFRDTLDLLARYRRAVEQASAAPLPPQTLAELQEANEVADLDYVTEQVPRALERSIEGLARVATLVLSMKEFAHPDQKEKLPADLNQALATTLTIARNEYKYVADVETAYGQLPPLLCHVSELNQVFLNLIVNAAQAIGEVVGGSGKRGVIRIATRQEADRVVVAVSDTGCGIPAAIRDKIFDPFFTTKPVGQGTGQGLAIARSIIVDKHGGTLTLESEVGKGTTFTIRLPLRQPGEVEAGSAAAA